MSSIILAAKRRRICLLASSFLVPIVLLGISAAHAQQSTSTDQLPAIEVNPPKTETRSRTEPSPDSASQSRRIVPAPVRQPAPAAQPSGGPATATAPSILAGSSKTIITADDIAHSPAQTVQEIIAQVPGVQLTTLYGGINGAQTNVDIRGFGAFATANTLVLVNGRRLNDIDLAGVDLSTIPRDSIERIEITKGNSGAVLYGDNAVGGVVNIVTKTGAGGPPLAARIEAGIGSFNQRQVAVSSSSNSGPWSTSVYGTQINSDGYRQNNALAQRGAIGDVRYTTPDISAYLTLSGDDQHLRLPGGRTVDPSKGVDELATDRRGASTPLNYADKQGVNATAGFTKTLWNGADLIVDGGVRDKQQQAAFFSPFGSNYVDTKLQTWSLTPRLNIKNVIIGMPSTILTGIDYYDAAYHSERPEFKGSPPIHVYDLSQQTLAAYWQQSIPILPTTDFSYGGRIQRTNLSARDLLNNAPDCALTFACSAQALPLDSNETQHALHIGIEHRFNNVFAIFGRAAHAFRTPNVDERVLQVPLSTHLEILFQEISCLKPRPPMTLKAASASRPVRSRCNPASTTWTSPTRSISIR